MDALERHGVQEILVPYVPLFICSGSELKILHEGELKEPTSELMAQIEREHPSRKWTIKQIRNDALEADDMLKGRYMNTKDELSDIEWTTCWMAIRYATGRRSISASMLPMDLVQAYWHRWTDLQKKQIVEDLQKEFEGLGDEAFGDYSWLKFWKALDETRHIVVETLDGKTHAVFEINGRLYPISEYISNPHQEIYLAPDSIKNPTGEKNISEM